MFKKKVRPANARKDSLPTEAVSSTAEPQEGGSSEGSSTGAGTEKEETNVGAVISDLQAMRRYRKQALGLDIEKLNRGEVKKRSRKKKADGEEEAGDDWVGSEGGLRPGKGGKEDEEEDNSENAQMKRLMSASNFTGQTNALDVDKHMMAYIEAELKKRRGGSSAEITDTAGEKKPFDPQAELYAIEEKYKVDRAAALAKQAKDEEEGSLVNSMAMLTAIPEVDLGMDNRLKNIEDTEKAKRKMLELRNTVVKPTQEESDFAAARFYQPHHRPQSDQAALEEAKREAMGLPPKEKRERNPKPELSTDEAVEARFRKRMRK